MTRNVCLQIKWRIRQGHLKSVLVYKAKEATAAKVVENWSSMHCNCNLTGIQCIQCDKNPFLPILARMRITEISFCGDQRKPLSQAAPQAPLLNRNVLRMKFTNMIICIYWDDDSKEPDTKSTIMQLKSGWTVTLGFGGDPSLKGTQFWC